jgi:hypothetical protein
MFPFSGERWGSHLLKSIIVSIMHLTPVDDVLSNSESFAVVSRTFCIEALRLTLELFNCRISYPLVIWIRC